MGRELSLLMVSTLGSSTTHVPLPSLSLPTASRLMTREDTIVCNSCRVLLLTKKSTETQKVLTPCQGRFGSLLSPSSLPSYSHFNPTEVSHLEMGCCCCGKHTGPVAVLAEPPLGLRQQVCVDFGSQEPGVGVLFHQAVHFPLGLVKAGEGRLLHVPSGQLPCLEVYVHLGKATEESWVLLKDAHFVPAAEQPSTYCWTHLNSPPNSAGSVTQSYKLSPKLGIVEEDTY